MAVSAFFSPDGLSIVIPVYNSAAILTELVERLHAAFAGNAFPFELILVNDGSEDDSWHVIVRLAKRFEKVHGVNLAGNFGQHNALLCGVRQACYEVIVTLDDDLQHPPEEIPKLLRALRDDVDVVYGLPMHRRHTAWRVAASWIMVQIARASGPGGAYRPSAFRAFRTRLREAFANSSVDRVAIDALLGRSTTRFTTVKVEHHPQSVGRSRYDLRRLTRLAVDNILAFGLFPSWLVRWNKRSSLSKSEGAYPVDASYVIAATTDDDAA
ncbi:MAG: glycosyltransferase family 2 protein [Candidatus Competibacteraceae bacterium]|nr:glycosyltransferase family 2 protein [Candidatus Competibacteraceae bacterium]